MRKIDAPVHLGVYSDNKWIELACGGFVEPKWGSDDDRKTTDPEVHVADDNRLYTFNDRKATCVTCKK
jgi:hypothetical protein